MSSREHTPVVKSTQIRKPDNVLAKKLGESRSRELPFFPLPPSTATIHAVELLFIFVNPGKSARCKFKRSKRYLCPTPRDSVITLLASLVFAAFAPEK